ncbi:unnamed protein product [Vitrella brassicaformis CCMP3155]|uniref:Acid phosphatase n=2 Tax=Vitrella brassicaformis TaxID=1169539 RepID=A0A0G4GMG0_VITBC|nr:unnamed protein product [Vitrella brassicaformis CCMP3155]|eukprot:CEM31376.1 unnamed protein product [Vitrella brassicaformis CCMP3155]
MPELSATPQGTFPDSSFDADAAAATANGSTADVRRNNRRLLFLVEVNRHGARSVLGEYENMENPGHSWPGGKGWLTAVGQRQHYEVGRIIREIYIKQLHFLSESYKPEEVYVRATEKPRTLMSAQSQMYGIFPNGHGSKLSAVNGRRALLVGVENLNGKIDIDALEEELAKDDTCALPGCVPSFPVFSAPRHHDPMLRAHTLDCAYVDGLMEMARESPEYKHYTDFYAKEIQDGAKLYPRILPDGRPISPFRTLAGIGSNIKCEETDGRTPMLSGHKHLTNVAKYLSEMRMSLVYGHPAFANFAGQYFFSSMADLFEAKAHPDNDKLQDLAYHRLKVTPGMTSAADFWGTLKFMMFAAHDTTLSYFLRYLEGFSHAPPFASTLFLELWEDPRQPSGHFVKFIYNWKPLKLNWCDYHVECGLDRVIQYWREKAKMDPVEKRCPDEFPVIYPQERPMV